MISILLPEILAGRKATDQEVNQREQQLLGLTELLPMTLACPISPNLGEEADWRVESEGRNADGG